MNPVRKLSAVAVLVASIFLMPMQTSAKITDSHPNDPVAVLTTIFQSLENGDVNGALEMVADNAVLTLPVPPPGFSSSFTGKEEIRAWWETFASWNPEIEVINAQTQGNMVMMSSYTTEDTFRALNIAPLRSETIAIVQNGLLTAYTVVFSAESEAKLLAALEREAKKELVRRFYDELWNEGNMAVADEIISPEFEDGFSGQAGIEPLKGTIEMFRMAFPDMKISHADVVAEGDLVVVTITNEMGAYAGGLPDFFGIPESAIGKEVVLTGIDYARIVDGKIVAGWGTHDDLGWLQQFGLGMTVAEE